jgi:Fe-S-cluster containining protein
MGKLSRRLRRRADNGANLRRAPEQTTERAFDLATTRATDISSIELDCADNTITVTIQVPVGANDGYAEYEEVLDLDEEHVPGYVHHAALGIAEAILRAVRERVLSRREVPCATCTAACCGRQFTSVRVTKEDFDRLQSAGVDTGKHVCLWVYPSFGGYIGELVLVPYKQTEEKACPFLQDNGCSIYAARPSICREYSAWTCDIYEEDPKKVDGKVKLGQPAVRAVRGSKR